MITEDIMAVILAAGESKRMWPLTLSRPKPLLPIFNEPLLLHTLRLLENRVNTAVIVVGYLENHIRNVLGDRIHGISIEYVVQPQRLGTGNAILQAKGHLTRPFLVLMGDNLYSEEDVSACMDPSLPYPCRMIAATSDHPERFGVLLTEGSRVLDVIEKPTHFISHLVNNGLYLLTPEVVPLLEGLPLSDRGEIEITDLLSFLASKGKLGFNRVSRKLALTYPCDLLALHATLGMEGKEWTVEGWIENGSVIQGPVHLGRNTLVRRGSHIEGPTWIGSDCEVGPHCVIRSCTCIGNHCNIGQSVEIRNSILMDDVHIEPLCFIANSILGEGVIMEMGSFTALETQTDLVIPPSLGTVLGDRAHTGAGTLLLPGSKLWPEITTLPGERICSGMKKGGPIL